MSRSVHKIVITGGPCAGKSTALSRIQKHFSQLDYNVVFVPETATELITSGVTPWNCGSGLDFQKCQLRFQLEKERIFDFAAGTMDCEKLLIVCDRGMIDNKVYMTQEEFEGIITSLGQNELELRDGYDAVFHLVTAAKGAQEFYTTGNNTARTETVEQAAELDDKLIAAWTGHPHLRVIDNSTDFEGKISRLIAEIAFFLGEPEPLEIERKFLIEYPELSLLTSIESCRRVEIIQTYLKPSDGQELRVRQRGENGHFIYFETIKRSITGMKRVEIERRLTKDEYLALLMDADTSKRQIRKDRYCLMYKNRDFEIDVYPFWNDRAIAEIELSHEDEEFEFPEFINVIKEVTDDKAYRNYSLATDID